MNPTKLAFLACILVGSTQAQTAWDDQFQAGLVHYRAGRLEAAIGAWRAAASEAKAFTNNDPRVAQTWNNLAAAQSAAGHYAEAEAAYGRAMATRGVTGLDLESAKTLNNLASLHRLTGRLDEAAAEVARAWPVVEAAPESADRSKTYFHILFNLAEIERARGEVDKADESADLLTALAAQLGDERLKADVLQLKAGLASAKGEWEQAERQQFEAFEIYERELPTTHPVRIQAGTTLGQILTAEGKLEAARPYLEAALASYEATLGPKHPQVAAALFSLARWKRESGDLAGVDSLLRRAVDIWSAAYGPYHASIASAWRELAQVFQAQGKYAGAEKLYERALEASEKVNDVQRVRDVLQDLARLYEVQRRSTAAARINKRLAMGLRD